MTNSAEAVLSDRGYEVIEVIPRHYFIAKIR
jgi:hypothetical protein